MVSLGVDDGEVYLGLSGGVAQEQGKGSREMRGERWGAARLFFPSPFRAGLSLCRAYGAGGLRDGGRRAVTSARAGDFKFENFK